MSIVLELGMDVGTNKLVGRHYSVIGDDSCCVPSSPKNVPEEVMATLHSFSRKHISYLEAPVYRISWDWV
jgi:hypothetical protein